MLVYDGFSVGTPQQHSVELDIFRCFPVYTGVYEPVAAEQGLVKFESGR
jgi:hypothetical protein